MSENTNNRVYKVCLKCHNRKVLELFEKGFDSCYGCRGLKPDGEPLPKTTSEKSLNSLYS